MFNHRPLVVALAALLTLVLSTASVAAQATPDATPTTGGTRLFPLPGDQVYPEGVAYDEETGTFFVGSTGDGTIFRGDIATGEVEVFSEAGADGRTVAVGMKLDPEGRLVVAGGPTGRVFVYDTASGELIASFGNGQPEGATFLNDIAITPAGDAYVTDSFSPTLYRVSASAMTGGDATSDAASPEVGGGELEAFLAFTDTPFEYVEGFNANGIVATPDGETLLVVQSNTGNLYRIDLASHQVGRVDLGGESLTGGDGMLLEDRTLYVVRQGQITVVKLGQDFTTGTLGEGFTDPSFASPSTIARYDGCLLVVNSQFAARQTGQPELPFTVSGVPIAGMTGMATPEGIATPTAPAC